MVNSEGRLHVVGALACCVLGPLDLAHSAFFTKIYSMNQFDIWTTLANFLIDVILVIGMIRWYYKIKREDTDINNLKNM